MSLLFTQFFDIHDNIPVDLYKQLIVTINSSKDDKKISKSEHTCYKT